MKYLFILNHNFIKKIICIITLFASSNLLAKTWNFDAILNGEIIGQHSFIYHDGKTTSQANFNFEFLLMDFFYKHSSLETWNGDCLASISSNTNNDGDLLEVNGYLTDTHFLVTSNSKSKKLPLCIMTFVYGNPAILKQNKLMNSQNGEYIKVNIQFIKQEYIVVKGDKILANLWEIKGDGSNDDLFIQLWYDQNMEWVGLKSSTPVGDIQYKLR